MNLRNGRLISSCLGCGTREFRIQTGLVAVVIRIHISRQILLMVLTVAEHR